MMERRRIYQVATIVATFWILDFLAHMAGVGETHYYFISKFANSVLFAVIWCYVFMSKARWKRILYSFAFGTFVSFYYLVSSYSGFVQWLGLYARYTPPPFVFFGHFYAPFWWWIFHALTFYVGMELSSFLKSKK